MIAKFVKEESLEEVVIKHAIGACKRCGAICKYLRRCVKASEGIGRFLHIYLIECQ